MKRLVISLQSAEDRRSHITQEFQKHTIDFDFFDALTPSLAKQYAQSLAIDVDSCSLTSGELACMMSHIAIWKKMIDENIPHLTIFEDDIYLGCDAHSLLTATDWIKPQWNIIKIEAFTKKIFLCSDTTFIGSNQRCITRLKGENLGTAGYILSLQGAKIYLDYIKTSTLRPLDELIFDDFITRCIEPVYQMLPALCIQEMLLNKEHPILPSALMHERKDRMHSEKKSGLSKLKRETNRVVLQTKKSLFAKELVFK